MCWGCILLTALAVPGAPWAPTARCVATPPVEEESGPDQGAAAASNEEAPPGNSVADASPPRPAPQINNQLHVIRERIIEKSAVPEVKKTLVELLFTYQEDPAARTLKVELLALSDEPSVQLLVAGALVDQFQRRPASTHPEYVDPLIAMLRAAEGEARVVAARALAFYANGSVVSRLVDVAADMTVPTPGRLAAIDALALHWGNRQAVGGLAATLEGAPPEIASSTMGALRSVTGESFGGEPGRWKSWWAMKQNLDAAAWQKYRMTVLLDRVRTLEAELGRRGVDDDGGQAHLVGRYAEMQKEFLRALPDDRKDARLAEWLRDSIEEVRQVALDIITARIGDGRRPEGDLRDALFGLIRDPSAVLRREALQAVENLQDAAALQPVLDALADEREVTVRRGMLRALGNLGQPGAIPVLIREIGRDGVDPTCEVQAASSLAQLAGRTTDRAVLDGAIEPLRARYGSADPADVALRGALLSAMAAAAPQSFQETFQQALALDDARYLVPAIRGLAAASDVSEMVRMRDLAKHSDRAVRLAAVETLGQLGGADADLEPLLTRLDKTAEPEERVRDAAWRSLLRILHARPIADQAQWSGRLRNQPDWRLRYLIELDAHLTTVNATEEEVRLVRELLVETFLAADRHADAAPILRALYEAGVRGDSADAAAWGLRLMASLLEARLDADLPDLIVKLAATMPAELGDSPIVQTIAAHLDAARIVADPQRTRAVLDMLKALAPETLGQPLATLIARIEQRLAPTTAGPSSGPD